MITLDEHIEDQKLPIPQGLIMDIEGAGYFPLLGMQKTLKSVNFLYMEYVHHHLKNVSNVTVDVFAALITPHFKNARFLKDEKRISLEENADKLISYLNELSVRDKSDDILFTK